MGLDQPPCQAVAGIQRPGHAKGQDEQLVLALPHDEVQGNAQVWETANFCKASAGLVCKGVAAPSVYVSDGVCRGR